MSAVQIRVLCWNIHKENITTDFDTIFSLMLQKYDPDVIALQEVQLNHFTHDMLHDFQIASTCNISALKRTFGLVTASRFAMVESVSRLSAPREFYVATKKALLITKHCIKEGCFFYLYNIHALNFVSSKTFEKELRTALKAIMQTKDPVIVAGDFNTWSQKRIYTLDDFANELGLLKCEISQHHLLKSFNKNRLDHIYYKGFKLLNAVALDSAKVSDHNPIVATMEIV